MHRRSYQNWSQSFVQILLIYQKKRCYHADVILIFDMQVAGKVTRERAAEIFDAANADQDAGVSAVHGSLLHVDIETMCFIKGQGGSWLATNIKLNFDDHFRSSIILCIFHEQCNPSVPLERIVGNIVICQCSTLFCSYGALLCTVTRIVPTSLSLTGFAERVRGVHHQRRLRLPTGP